MAAFTSHTHADIFLYTYIYLYSAYILTTSDLNDTFPSWTLIRSIEKVPGPEPFVIRPGFMTVHPSNSRKK